MSAVPHPEWVRSSEDSVVLLIHAVPGAKTNSIAGVYDGRLKIKIAAKAEDGKANKMLCKYLASVLGCSFSSITLIKGDSSRAKSLAVAGLNQTDITAILHTYL